MTINIIIIGDEILSGKRQDKHMEHSIKVLKKFNLHANHIQYLGDDLNLISSHLRYSFNTYNKINDAVFCFGGIGATPDDKTRQACALALDVKLILHPDAKNLIVERIKIMQKQSLAPLDLNHSDNIQRLKMGEFPLNANIIPNNFNNIPGFSIKNHFFLPGFPSMSWPMLEWILANKLNHLCNPDDAEISLSCIVPLIPESTLAPLLFRIEEEFNYIKTYSLPSLGEKEEIDVQEKTKKKSEWENMFYIEVGIKGKSSTSILLQQIFNQLTQQINSLGYETIFI